MELKDSLWVEKYRPRKIEDLRLPEDYKIDFTKYIKDKDIPHLLLYGPAGSGKSTLARILCSKNGLITKKMDNVLEINGSAKSSRGISFVSEVIEPFLKHPPAGNDPFKIVFIDEIDSFTPDSFKALRGIIEKYSKFGRFVVTCNYVSKIPDPIQSRFGSGMYLFEKIPTDFIISYCKQILEKEEIKYDEKDVKYVVDSLYPDVRKIVGILQRNSATGELKIQENILTNEKKIVTTTTELIEFLKNGESKKVSKNMSEILNLVNTPGLQFRNVYEQLFFSKGVPVPCKVIINKYSNDHNFCLSPSMHFMGMIFEIIQSMKEYSNATST